MAVPVLFFLLVGSWGFAQVETLQVKGPTIVCQTCRRTIIRGLSTQRGIRGVEVDVPSKVITVVYRPDKTTPDRIRQAITRLGYDADSLPRDPKAFERLPACCKRQEPHRP